MNVMREIAVDAVTGVKIFQKLGDLVAFRQPQCAVAIWDRQPARDFQTWIDALDPDLLPNGRMILALEDLQGALADLCDDAHLPTCAQRDFLINDIIALSGLFAGLMRAPYLRVRLQAVNTNACRRFHVDAITARLVCTYRGTGTQYGTSHGGSDPADIFTVPTGSPILMRGTLWPSLPASGLLHRSPPIEHTGETRLVLVIDPVFDPE
jgi:hypothetical protein